MIEMLFAVLVILAILGLVYWAAHRIIAAAGMPPIVGVIVDVALVVIVVVLLLGLLTGSLPSVGIHRFRA